MRRSVSATGSDTCSQKLWLLASRDRAQQIDIRERLPAGSPSSGLFDRVPSWQLHFAFIGTEFGLDRRLVELYQSFGIVETKPNARFSNAK